MYNNISVLAGSKAFEIIKDEGLDLDRVKVLAGASGAAKFLVLTGIDRVLMPLLKDRKKNLHLIGSSIGSFRMAAYIQKNPVKALDILEQKTKEIEKPFKLFRASASKDGIVNRRDNALKVGEKNDKDWGLTREYKR